MKLQNSMIRQMRRVFATAGFLLLCSLANSVGADAAEETALQLYEAGEYEAAVVAGRKSGGADDLALAARARLVIVRFSDLPEDRLVGIAEALSDARTALALAPDHIEANLQIAIAVGYRGQLQRSNSDARLALLHIERALAQEPDNAWALAALGGWHTEVVLEAGTLFGRILFGARRSLAVESFRAAVAAEPENLSILAGYANALLRFGRDRYRKEAIPILKTVSALAPRHALETVMQDHARRLLLAVNEGREDDLKELLREMALFTPD